MVALTVLIEAARQMGSKLRHNAVEGHNHSFDGLFQGRWGDQARPLPRRLGPAQLCGLMEIFSALANDDVVIAVDVTWQGLPG